MSQLRALVERMEAPEARVGYVLDRIEKCFGISPHAANRGLWLASQVLGCGHHPGEICRTAPGFMLGEHAVHCELREYRHVGEWFDLRSIWSESGVLQ